MFFRQNEPMFIGKVTYVRWQSKLTSLAISPIFVEKFIYFGLNGHKTATCFSISRIFLAVIFQNYIYKLT